MTIGSLASNTFASHTAVTTSFQPAPFGLRTKKISRSIVGERSAAQNSKLTSPQLRVLLEDGMRRKYSGHPELLQKRLRLVADATQLPLDVELDNGSYQFQPNPWQSLRYHQYIHRLFQWIKANPANASGKGNALRPRLEISADKVFIDSIVDVPRNLGRDCYDPTFLAKISDYELLQVIRALPKFTSDVCRTLMRTSFRSPSPMRACEHVVSKQLLLRNV